MARVPQQVSRQVIPSGRVPGAVIPFDIADVGQGIEARGLADLGRGIEDTGRVIAELVLRDRKANDLKQASVDAVDRQDSRLAVEEWKNKNPLDQHTAENFAKVWDENTEFDPSKYLDETARERAEITNAAERDNFIRTSAITATDTRIRDTILSTRDAYILEPNQLNRNNYEDALGLMHTEDRVDSLIAAADAQAQRLTEERNETLVLDAAFAAWRDTGRLEDGLAIIDKSGLDDKARLENELKTRITNREAEDKIKLEKRQETDRNTINKAMYVDKNYTASFDAIQQSSLSEKDKALKFKENEDRARLAARGEPERNDPEALDVITTAIAQVGNDTLPLSDAKAIYNEKSLFLKSTTADSLLKELNKAFDASVDTADARVRTDVRLRAVGKTESALDVLLEALVGVKEKDRKPLEERIASAREKFNLELSNFNRWEIAQRAWRRTNNTATPEQIQQEGMRAWFTEFAGKDVAQLRKEEEPGTVPGEEPKPPRKLADEVPVVRIRMVSPDGRSGTIPEDKVEDAIKQGWKKL